MPPRGEPHGECPAAEPLEGEREDPSSYVRAAVALRLEKGTFYFLKGGKRAEAKKGTF